MTKPLPVQFKKKKAAIIALVYKVSVLKIALLD